MDRGAHKKVKEHFAYIRVPHILEWESVLTLIALPIAHIFTSETRMPDVQPQGLEYWEVFLEVVDGFCKHFGTEVRAVSTDIAGQRVIYDDRQKVAPDPDDP